ARAFVGAVRLPLRRVAIVAAPGGVVLVGISPARPGAADVAAAEALLVRTASVRGVAFVGSGERVTVGDARVLVSLQPGLGLEVPADVFTQVNERVNQRLVDAVLESAAIGPGSRVLDLYAGAGNFALPAARRGAVVRAIERDPAAVEAGRANAAR